MTPTDYVRQFSDAKLIGAVNDVRYLQLNGGIGESVFREVASVLENSGVTSSMAIVGAESIILYEAATRWVNERINNDTA